MRVLITGGKGQLGKALVALLQNVRPRDPVLAPGREELDVSEKARVDEVVGAFRPDVIVHLAAWTDVDGCEQDPPRAHRVHVDGTRNVVEAAGKFGCRVWMASTDYVFDGEKGQPYEEEDPPNPINVYGTTKRMAEELALAYDRAWVVRTSWVFGDGENFVRKVLRWAERGRLEVVADQVGSPTYTEDLADAILRFLTDDLPPGLYHLANTGATTRYAWARLILDTAGLDVALLPACSSAFPAPAPRPRATPLASKRWISLGLPPLPPWEDATRRFLQKFLS